MEEKNNLVKMLKEEFNRPVPHEYTTLIERARGGRKTEHNLFPEEPIFFTINDSLVWGLLQRLRDGGFERDIFEKHIKDKDFIDLGCGHPELPRMLRNEAGYRSVADFAASTGAKRYIGVDLIAIENYSTQDGNFNRVYVSDEILHFLSTIPDANKHLTNKFLFFSGLESEFTLENHEFFKSNPKLYRSYLKRWDSEVADYHHALHKEIDRITKIGDVVYIGDRTTSIQPERAGFKQNAEGFFVKE